MRLQQNVRNSDLILEIGTLALENPSLNLVRRDDGHWNLEELIERTSQAHTAPTAAARPEYRNRFPYVEATAGRINFKLGPIKKAFAFSDADFALWLETENEWGVRLEARPMRADVPVGDAGMLRMEGKFQRAPSLRDTPVNLKATLTKGQLGRDEVLLTDVHPACKNEIALFQAQRSYALAFEFFQ